MRFTALILSFGLLAGCGTEEGDDPGPDPLQTENGERKTPEGSGTLTGRVLYEGSIPDSRIITINKDDVVCKAASGPRVDVRVNDGGLADVVVEVLGVKKPEGGWTWKDGSYEIHQKGCIFTPHVLVTRDGAELTIHNHDPVLHNIATGLWDVGQPSGADPAKKTVRFSGRPFMRGTCNVHSWMEMWIYVARSPYHARVDDQGNFSIAGIPAGKYRVIATHPTLGTQRLKITIGDGKTERHEVTFRKR